MKYVKEFEGLRGLMALWVVIGHWATSVPLSFAPLPPKLYNAYAVDVFIMLSGFATRFKYYAYWLAMTSDLIVPLGWLVSSCCRTELNGNRSPGHFVLEMSLCRMMWCKGML